MPIEASPEDVADQRAEVDPDTRFEDGRPAPELPWDADPADVADQRFEVPLGDESY
jgi:hypothetical protein